VKCAIVEKNVSSDRVGFLKQLLEFNGFSVVVVPSPPPKSVPAPVAEKGEQLSADPVSSTFTVGVTDVTFNSTNAIFGRLLRTPDGKVVSMAYWQEKEKVSEDTIPYYSKKVL
jgi:hypothetical protein